MAKRKTKYQSIQKILSGYTKKKGIHLGREFNKVASMIYKSNKNASLKDIRKNIGKLHAEHRQPEKVIVFIPDFPFYNFEAEIGHSDFDGVEINVVTPGHPQFSFSAIQLDAIELFQTSGLKVFLRTYYGDSPVARFILEDTDNKTTVTYMVDLGERKPVTVAPKEQPLLQEPSTISDDKQFLLELEKQKEKTAIAETEKLKQRAITLKEEREYVKELKDLGFSNAEIMDRLNKI